MSKLDIAWHGEDQTIHWDPNFRNQLRYRMTNWPQALNYSVIQGALCTRIRRWGYPVCPTHPARPQEVVSIDVTYTFYKGLPYFLMESRLNVEGEVDILVVRNDEWLFRQAFTHSLVIMEDGEIRTTAAAEHVSVEQNPALVGFFSERTKEGFVSLRLAYDARGFPGAYDPRHLSIGTTDYGNQVWVRDVFHVGTEMAIQPGSTVGETCAYLFYNIAVGGNQQAMDWYEILRRPLQVSEVG